MGKPAIVLVSLPILFSVLQFLFGIGIALVVFILHLVYTWLAVNLYVANFLAILLVTLWNFWMNACFNWKGARFESVRN